MSKESSLGAECPGCGQRIYYVEQHIPNCPNYPAHIAQQVKRAAKLKSEGA